MNRYDRVPRYSDKSWEENEEFRKVAERAVYDSIYNSKKRKHRVMGRRKGIKDNGEKIFIAIFVAAVIGLTGWTIHDSLFPHTTASSTKAPHATPNPDTCSIVYNQNMIDKIELEYANLTDFYNKNMPAGEQLNYVLNKLNKGRKEFEVQFPKDVPYNENNQGKRWDDAVSLDYDLARLYEEEAYQRELKLSQYSGTQYTEEEAKIEALKEEAKKIRAEALVIQQSQTDELNDKAIS